MSICLSSGVCRSETSLKISAFRDITAFVLQGGSAGQFTDIQIKYVANADEAHNDLTQNTADLVFMSYDDTLSLYLGSNKTETRAVMPVHGGILDFSGEIDVANGRNIVGIDTDSGYARALRKYLQESNPDQYAQLDFQQVGATNIRYDKLTSGVIDATLLNPPYSYLPGAPRIVRMYDVIGSYEGVVVNANSSWLADPSNVSRLQRFSNEYFARIDEMASNRDATIAELKSFYQISDDTVAGNIYDRLWMADGLARSSQFDMGQLNGTESIYSWSTGQTIPSDRTWIAPVPEPSSVGHLILSVLAFIFLQPRSRRWVCRWAHGIATITHLVRSRETRSA